MTEIQKRKFREYVIAVLSGISVSVLFTAMMAKFNPTALFAGSCIGASIGLGATALQDSVVPRLRRLPFLASLLSIAVTYIVLISIVFVLIVWVIVLTKAGTVAFHRAGLLYVVQFVTTPAMRIGLVYAFGITILFTFFGTLSQKLGPGVLTSWLLGRYHSPRREERIFMFLDMRGSTTLAETLGEMRFSALIQDFFNDLTGPIIESKGEVSHFIGDEVVLTWTMKNGLKKGNCVRCFFRAQEAMERRKAYYLRTYGLVPEFKAGVHCGPVVVTEVGQIKSEIVFHGDVLNTASRIQSLCNELKADLLLSAELADLLQGADLPLQPLGAFQLKGKAQKVALYQASPQRILSQAAT